MASTLPDWEARASRNRPLIFCGYPSDTSANRYEHRQYRGYDLPWQVPSVASNGQPVPALISYLASALPGHSGSPVCGYGIADATCSWWRFTGEAVRLSCKIAATGHIDTVTTWAFASLGLCSSRF